MAGFAAGGHGSGMQKQLVGRLYVRLIHCLATKVPKIDLNLFCNKYNEK